MTKRLSIALMMCVAITLLVAPAMAANLQNVSLGNDVFIGEQGLNLIGISSGQVLAYYTGSQTVGSECPGSNRNSWKCRKFLRITV